MSDDALHNLCRADPVWAERYEGWVELGHGGSATVVRTHGKALGEDLALKVFPHLAREEWTRFRQEVSTAQKLTSPFIVRTYSPFPRGTFAWIELELIEGGTLRHELERRAAEGRAFAAEQVLAVGASVASALATAHAAGVTHRDVKPANILLPRGGRPPAKLGDFGVSRLAGAARLTSTGLLVGTPQFAAPEVAAGAQAEPPADVYSLALCLFLMLSGGRPPFRVEDEASPSHWLRAHTEQPPRPITEFDRAVPAPLADLLARGLSKDPAQRPTAAEALAILERLQRDDNAAAVTAPRPVRHKRLAAGAAGAATLAALASLVLWANPGPPPVAPLAARPASAPATMAAPAAAARVLPPAAPDGPPARPALPQRATPQPSAAAVAPRVEERSAFAAASPAPAPSATAEPQPVMALVGSPPVSAPAASGSPIPEPATAPPPAAGDRPPAPDSRTRSALQVDGLLRARAVAIGRHEGLPGQREMVLVDALHGEEWIWFRFRLEGGVSQRIARVSWERGEITSWVQEPAGTDLRVIVQVPRADVTRAAHLVLDVDGGPSYTFALGSRSLGRFLKELFQ